MAVHDEPPVNRRRKKPSRPPQLSENTAAERQPRRRKRHHPVLRFLLRLTLVAAVAAGCLWASRNVESLSPSAMADRLEGWFSGGSRGDGFPLSVDGDAVLSAGALGDSLALLSDNAFTVYNKNAGETARRLHNYADPLMATSGSYALIAELGGSRLTLEKRSGTVCELTAPGTVTTAAVSANGRIAVATGADKSHTAKITVYDRRGKELYTWVSADLRIVYLAFCADGSRVAAVGVSSHDAKLRSTLTVIPVSGDKAAEYAADDVLLCAAEFAGTDTVIAVGTDEMWAAAADGSGKTVYSYKDRELSGFAVGSSLVGLVLRPYGSADGGELTVLDTAANERQTAAFSEAFRCLTADGDRLLLLTEGRLRAYTADGVSGDTAVSADGRLVAAPGGRPLVVGLTAVTAYTWENTTDGTDRGVSTGG